MTRYLDSIERNLLLLLFLAMPLITFVEVVLRAGFHMGFDWVQEVTLNLMAWFILLGAPYLLKIGGHIGVSMLTDRLSGFWRRWVSLLACALCIAYAGIFALGAWQYLVSVYAAGIGMEDVYLPAFLQQWFSEDWLWQVLRADVEHFVLPFWLARGVLLWSFMLFFWRLLGMAWHLWRGDLKHLALADEASDALSEHAQAIDVYCENPSEIQAKPSATTHSTGAPQ